MRLVLLSDSDEQVGSWIVTTLQQPNLNAYDMGRYSDRSELIQLIRMAVEQYEGGGDGRRQ